MAPPPLGNRMIDSLSAEGQVKLFDVERTLGLSRRDE
jgi:hypothetical protein